MNQAELIRLVDQLEDRAETYVTLDELLSLTSHEDVDAAVAARLLLVDYRTRTDGSEITLCRLNRRHPAVKDLTRW